MALTNPITCPLFVSVGLAAAYLGLCSSLSISRDRDLGHVGGALLRARGADSYVLGKYSTSCWRTVVVLIFALINFYGISLVTNVGFSVDIVGIMILSIFLTSCMVSFGIVLSVSTRRMIVSVVLFLALVLFFLVFSIVHSWMIGHCRAKPASAMVYVRVILDNANQLIRWISPVDYYLRGMNAVLRQDTGRICLSSLSSVALHCRSSSP